MLSIGIIGYGRIGAEHAVWLSKCQLARAVAVADATPARRDLARSHGLQVFETLNQLLDAPSIDAVLVSTPTSMHFGQAVAALKANKHVMVEKPVTTNLPQAKDLIELAASRRRVLSVFHNRRWDLDFLTLKAAVAANRFGKLLNVESRLGQFASCVGPAAREYRPNWRNEAAFGGGALFDWGSHFVDQILQLMLPARPVRVFAQLRNNIWSPDCDDFARVIIDFEQGAAGLVEINTTTTRPLPRWHVDGSLGSAESPFSSEFDVRHWSEFQFTPADASSEPFRLPLAPPGLSESQIWDQFAAAVRGDGPPAITTESVLPTMEIVDATRLSSTSGKAVEIP